MPSPTGPAFNIPPDSALDQVHDPRFRAIEKELRNLFERLQSLATETPNAPVVDWSAGTDGTSGGGGGGGGGGSNVEPGTIDGQILRWDDSAQEYVPVDNVLVDADGNITVDATEIITSQANASAFAVREKSGGQSQPVAVFQTQSGFAAVRFTPSSALLRVLPETVGGGVVGADGFQGVPIFQGRRAQGTQPSPSQTLSGNRLVSVQGVGYTSSGYESSAPGAFELAATEDHTPTAQGTRGQVKTTPNGTAIAVEALGIENNGDITVAGKALVGTGFGAPAQGASALGALIGVYEAFNESGVLIGYAPIYNGFTP